MAYDGFVKFLENDTGTRRTGRVKQQEGRERGKCNVLAVSPHSQVHRGFQNWTGRSDHEN